MHGSRKSLEGTSGIIFEWLVLLVLEAYFQDIKIMQFRGHFRAIFEGYILEKQDRRFSTKLFRAEYRRTTETG